MLRKLKTTAKTFAQHLFITLDFFNRNGLANHAAAAAYGFLLSAAPMILIVSFFLVRAFRAAPQALTPFLNIPSGENWPALEELISMPPGIPTLVSIIGILWAGRIFAVSLHRGLKIVFVGKKKRNPVTDNLVTLAIEFTILVVMLAVILGSRAARHLYSTAGGFRSAPFPYVLEFLSSHQTLQLVLLGILLYFAYRAIPANPPSRLSALFGGVFCVVAYGAATTLIGLLQGQPGYNFLEGALGDLFVLLASIYFFFLFFFLGAQFAAVTNSFDALFFLRLRETRIKAAGNGKAPKPADRLFRSTDGKLKKYYRFYRAGETVLSKGDLGTSVYFLLEGEAEVLLPSLNEPGDSAGTLQAGTFLGEMGYLLSESRTATIRAKTDLAALELPPQLFETILDSDVNLDRSIIENLSSRIKNDNERIAALSRNIAQGNLAPPPA